jgi:hypothetical protein
LRFGARVLGTSCSRRNFRSAPSVGLAEETLLEAGQFPQGTAFLQKPFTLASLPGKVREVLASTKSQ